MSARWSGVATYRDVRRLGDKAFSLFIGSSFAAFGPRSVIQRPVRIVGEEMIWIGAGTFIGSNSWLQALNPLDEPDRVRLHVGDGTSIAGHCVISAVEQVTIGRSVLLARNVYVSDHSHAFDDRSLPVLEQGVADVAPVEIADGAWLGQNTVVTPGVRIGRGAVIGANSVVTSDVPDGTVAVGVPARVIRELA